jgi:hypothetical protein
LSDRFFAVDNRASGFALTVTGGSGASVVVPAGVLGLLYGDGTNINLVTSGAAVARNSAELMAQFVLGAVATNGPFWFSYKAPYAGTINALDAEAGSGSFTVEVEINGTPVTGLSAVVVTPTPATTPATGANTFAAGAKITGIISAASGSPANAALNLDITWS